MYLDPDDLRQLLEEAGRFARERVGSLAARWEHPMAAEELASLTQEAGELGIVPRSATEEGFGIWSSCHDASSMAFSLSALRKIAWASPGVAFAWHRQALAALVARQLGLALADADLQGTVLVPTGHYGLARASLARWLKGASLRPDDDAMLQDWFDRRTHATPLYAPPRWTHVLWPVWAAGQVAWQLAPRMTLVEQRGGAQHGFDELAGYLVQRPESGDTVTAPAQAGPLYETVLKADMLGLLAIGTGIIDRGLELARDYASIRRQGGKHIIGHPAVQHLLGDIEIARQQADLALAAFARPAAELDLGTVAATRAGLTPALCLASNQAMQVHGGIGYMRDAGPEKLLRDQNMLRLMTGGIRDIHNFLAGWTGAYA